MRIICTDDLVITNSTTHTKKNCIGLSERDEEKKQWAEVVETRKRDRKLWAGAGKETQICGLWRALFVV